MGFHDHYDRLYAAKDHAGEADVIRRILGLDAGYRLLEAGCGTGRHSRAFATAGISVAAVDTDTEMIAQAMAASPGENPVYHAGTVASLADGGFDGAAALFNVANYVTSRNLLRDLFASISERLKPGAGFTFDCWNGVAVIADPPRNEVRSIEADGWSYRVEITADTDFMRQTSHIRNAFEATGPSGERETFTHDLTHRLWTPADLRDALTEAGFGRIDFLRWMQPGQPATMADWKMLVLARKPD